MISLDRLRTGRVRAVLIGLGLAMIVRGVWTSGTTSPSPRNTLATFARALETGDRELAVSLFRQDSRDRMPQGVPDGVWTPAKRFQWQVKSLQQVEEYATARLYIRDAGYFVEPIVELRRSDAGEWQITSVELDRVDARYADDRKRQAEADLDALATEIASALRDSPTILAAEPNETPTRK